MLAGARFPLHDEEHGLDLPLHYLFDAIPVRLA